MQQREELESWAVGGSRLVVDAGIGIWYADLADADPAATTTTSVVPSAKQALECDYKGVGADSGRGNWEGDAGYASPREALEVAIAEGAVIPQAGYRTLARNDTAVLYGYEHEGEVKVAVRVTAVPGSEDGWVSDRLIACRLVEFGPKADMGRGGLAVGEPLGPDGAGTGRSRPLRLAERPVPVLGATGHTRHAAGHEALRARPQGRLP